MQQAHSTTPHDSVPPPAGGHSMVVGSGANSSGAGQGGPTGSSGPPVGSSGAGGPVTVPPPTGLPGLPHSLVTEPDPRPSPPAPSPR